jgi:hypothetical protein
MRTTTTGWIRRAALAVALVACSPSAIPGDVVPDSAMTLEASNGTNLVLELVVNDAAPVPFGPGELKLSASSLPALPWHAVVRFPGGRSLVDLTVRSGDVLRGPNYEKGDGARVDLSCGRIDIWSGPRLLGPVPTSGHPGDCTP